VPLVERLPELTSDHRVVLELSELQLPTLSRGTTVAVYTNVTSDHLDRHGTVEGYRAAKRRLAELVDPDGALILNDEDPVVAAYAELRTAPVVAYRRASPLEGGVGVTAVDDPWIVARNVRRLAAIGGGIAEAGPDGRIMPLDGLQIPGWHSISNALAAIAVGLVFGVAPDAIRDAASEFRGVEHRLEEVAIVDRVRFVNDSQGTQPDAVIAAIHAFRRPIVLIAGGRDKGVDLSELAQEVAQGTSAVVLIGESGRMLAELFSSAGHERIERADSLEDAVLRADTVARELLADAGPADLATVLLSPAAASFDMFVDYAARGRAFKTAVAALAGERQERST
jgi:UDP-N-acetylmuramoylalanine--D-glutamate ligase